MNLKDCKLQQLINDQNHCLSFLSRLWKYMLLYALPEVLTHFVDTTATLFPCTQQKVGGHTSAMIDSGGLTFTAKAVDGDKTVTFGLNFFV